MLKDMYIYIYIIYIYITIIFLMIIILIISISIHILIIKHVECMGSWLISLWESKQPNQTNYQRMQHILQSGAPQ